MLSEGSCDSHKHLLAPNWLMWDKAQLWKTASLLQAGHGWFGVRGLFVRVSWQVSEVLGTEV